MNKYYQLLIHFCYGEKIERKRLLRLGRSHSAIDKSLIDECLEKGYIKETNPNDIGEIRYVITELGKNIRDN